MQTWEHPAFRLLVACATFFGNQTTCIVCGLCVYWALSRRKGFELCVMLWATLAVNTALKGIFAVPRPFVEYPSVLRAAADGYSTPSSHAQLTAVFWMLAAGFVFRRLPAAARAALAVLPPLAVSVSRVALGVHYPTLAVGYLTTAGALLFWDGAAGALGARRTALKFLCLAVFCLALGVTVTAGLFGFAAGYLLLSRKGELPAVPQTAADKTLACAFGVAVYLACNAALKRVTAAGIPLQTPLGGVNAAAFLRFASGAVPAFAAALVPGRSGESLSSTG